MQEDTQPLSAALRYAEELSWLVLPNHWTRTASGDQAAQWAELHPDRPLPPQICGCDAWIECTSPGKHPLGNLAPRGFHSATTDPTTLRQWWRSSPKAHIGVATGLRSGVVVLDFDTKSGGPESLRRLLLDNCDRKAELADFDLGTQDGLDRFYLAVTQILGTAAVRTGSGGLHLYFRWLASLKGKTCSNAFGAIDLPGIDIRSDGGYVIAPPSGHATGGSYEWLLEPWGAPVWPALAHSHLSRPEERPEGALKVMPPWLSDLLTDPAFGRGSHATAGSESLGRDRYSLPEVIPQGQRDDELTRYAGSLRARGYERTAILEALRLANERCSPHVSDRDLKRIASSIAKKPKGSVVETAPPLGSAVSADDLARRRNEAGPEPLNHLRPVADLESPSGIPKVVPGSDPNYEQHEKPQSAPGKCIEPSQPTWAFCSITELLATPDDEVAWLVDQLLGRGELSALIGKSGHGKSTFTRALMRAVAEGKTFLGRTTHPTGKILYLALEDHAPQLKLKLRLQDWGSAGDRVFVFFGELPEEAITSLPAQIEAHGACLVVVDTLFPLLQATESSEYAYMTNLMVKLRHVARSTGAHVLVLHHARKGELTEDSTLGSSAIAGAMDTILFLSKTPGGARTLSTSKQRYGTEMVPTELIFDAETQQLSLGSPRSRGREMALQEKIMDVLRGSASMTETELKKGIRDTALCKMLRYLVDEGVVVRSGGGKKNSPFLYRLSEEADPPFGGEAGGKWRPEPT